MHSLIREQTNKIQLVINELEIKNEENDILKEKLSEQLLNN